MADFVKVACRVPNGLNIRLSKPGFDDGTGVKAMVHDGPGVRLNGPSVLQTGAGNTMREDLPPGETSVDADWMGRWLDQNSTNPLVTMEQVFLLDEEKKEPNPTR